MSTMLGLNAKWLDPQQLRARWLLRCATELGDDLWVSGRPFLRNFGFLRIGSGFKFGSSPGQSHIVVERAGRMVIGNDVTISFGAAIHCRQAVNLGDGCQIGPFVVIHDSDFHVVGQREARAEPLPIVIGNRVHLGARVTIMRGTTIGEGATVLGGSVVSGQIEPGSVVGGVPARPVSELATGGSTDLREFVMRVLGLETLPGFDDGPDQIPAWDSLGSLKLLLALEDAYQVTVREDAMNKVHSIGALALMLEDRG